MAGCMTTEEMKKIHMDFNAKMDKLRKEKELQEAAEYKRIADTNKTEEANRLAENKRQSDEANLAASTIIETDVEHSSSDTSEDDKGEQMNSDTAGPSAGRKGQTNFESSEDEQPPLKTKKTLKRRIYQTRDTGEICILLNTLKLDLNILKEENATIIRRLTALEVPTEPPIANTNAETSQKGAFLALKIDWMPKVLNMLALIYAEVQQNTDE